MTADNPFDAPRADVEPPRWGSRPGCRALIAFVLRRATLNLVLPVGIGALAASVGGSFWLTAAATSAVFLPGTLIHGWNAFLAPVDDDRPVVVTTGLVRNRSGFLWSLRASAFERLAVTAGFFALLALLSLGHALFAVLLPFAALIGLWLVLSGWQSLVLGRAIVASVSSDPEGALATVGVLLRHPWWNWLVLGPARLTAGHALARLGRVDEALAQFASARGAVARQAELAAAGLRIGRGEREAGRALLGTRKPRSLGEQVAWETAHVLLALEEGRPRDVLDRAAGWTWLRGRMGPQLVESLAIYEAAAHAACGDVQIARGMVRPEWLRERAWMATCYPRLWAALAPLLD